MAKPPFRHLSEFALILLLLVLAAGCASPSSLDSGVTGPFHKVGNYYLLDQKLPPGIRRVAMLPLTASQNDRAAVSGRETLQPVLYSEIAKARMFEVQPISSDKLEQWTGRSAWSAGDTLPAHFLARIRDQTACDAILFSELTVFRAYPPVAVGWRMLLVRADDSQPLWSVDEIFDSGEPRVRNSARRYALENERINAELAKEAGTRSGAAFSTRVAGWDSLNSPSQFARYAASAAIETLTVKAAPRP